MKGLISDDLEDEQVLPRPCFSIPIHLSLANVPPSSVNAVYVER